MRGIRGIVPVLTGEKARRLLGTIPGDRRLEGIVTRYPVDTNVPSELVGTTPDAAVPILPGPPVPEILDMDRSAGSG